MANQGDGLFHLIIHTYVFKTIYETDLKNGSHNLIKTKLYVHSLLLSSKGIREFGKSLTYRVLKF